MDKDLRKIIHQKMGKPKIRRWRWSRRNRGESLEFFNWRMKGEAVTLTGKERKQKHFNECWDNLTKRNPDNNVFNIKLTHECVFVFVRFVRDIWKFL